MTATTVPGYSCRVRSSQATDSASRWLVGSSSSSRSGLDEQQPAQRDAAALAAREGRDVGVARRQAQRVHGDLEGAVEVPGAGGVDLGLEVGLLVEQRVDVGVGVAEGGADLVVAVDQLLGLADALGHVAGDVLGRVELRLLGQVADGEARGEARLAGEAVVLARHDPQQRGLARAVGPDDADLGAGIEGQVDALEDLAVGRVEALEAAHGVDELGGHRDQCARWAAPLRRSLRSSLLCCAAFSSLNLWCWARMASCVAPWFGTSG